MGDPIGAAAHALNAPRRLKYSVFSAQYIGDEIVSFVMTRLLRYLFEAHKIILVLLICDCKKKKQVAKYKR